MSDKTGGCLCGQVRYTFSGDPLVCVTCHCTNCQKQAGTALSVIVGVAETALEIEGEVKTYNDTGDSGSPVYRQFCPECGSPVFTRLDRGDGMMFIKAGTFDDTSWIKPAFHCYTKSKQPWVELGEVPAFETVPEGM
ncbi:MAG: GFA family protein [Pseudomonadota bacterium]